MPPMIIFPKRKRFLPELVKDAPAGTIGGVSDSGWITSPLFVEWLHHFIEFSGASQQRRVLLVMDNHPSHVSMDVVCEARKAGVDIVTLPPHCSHFIQPLDKTVYGPLKAAWNRQIRYWHDANPGARVNDRDIAKLFKAAADVAFKQENIASGFEACGIVPYNPDRILQDPDFGTHNEILEWGDDPDPGRIDRSHATESRRRGPSTEDDARPTAVAGEEEEAHDDPAGQDLPATESSVPLSRAATVDASSFQNLLTVKKKMSPKRGRGTKKQSVWLTSSPVKKAMEDEAATKKKERKETQTDKTKRSMRGKQNKRPRRAEASARSDDLCLICGEGVVRSEL